MFKFYMKYGKTAKEIHMLTVFGNETQPFKIYG
jgi:hypothetical protein